MIMNTKVKKKINTARWLCVAVCLAVVTCLISCEKKAPAIAETVDQVYSVAVENYKSKGLEITHPADWVLLHDEPGIIADRTVAFETPDASRITVFFYKSETRTYSDLANELEKQLRLRNSKDVEDFTRETLELGNYKGLKLSWVSLGLAETTNEASFVQLRAEPYPVLVQFHLFDDDIETQKNNLVPFLQGISLTKPR